MKTKKVDHKRKQFGGIMGSPHYEIVKELGFFAYSGDDGDLFRKHKLGGWRVRLYGQTASIQSKGDRWGGVQRWNTHASFVVPIDLEDFKRTLRHLVSHKELPPA